MDKFAEAGASLAAFALRKPVTICILPIILNNSIAIADACTIIDSTWAVISTT